MNIMMRETARTFGFAGVIAVLAGFTLLHPDDPKIKDTLPRYEGPSWRKDVDQGLSPIVFNAHNVELMSWITLPEFGQELANDIWGYVSPSGREYAIIGLGAATGFVEVTQPGNAQIVAVMPGPAGGVWRDMKTYDQYAYAVSEDGGGVQVFDLRQIDNGVVTHVRDVTTGGSTSSHNVALNADSGFLYRCGGSNNGLRIYDLADPSNPSWVDNVSDRYVHDAHIVSFAQGPYAGREIAFCCGGYNGGWDQTGLWIVDVTDKENIFTVSHTQYSGSGYSHQGWLSEDGQYFYLADELDESNYGHTTRTRVFDVSDLASPFVAATFTNGSTAIDHNLFVKGNMIFESNYASGLRVFDASDPLAPVEVAYFDTIPEHDRTNFNGLWGTFPYFPSGTVIGSDREKGLFVWRLTGTTVNDVQVVTGTVLEGDVSSIRASDDVRLRTRSGFGSTLVDLHHMEVLIGANTTVDGAANVEITVESSIDQPSGSAQIRVRNWTTGQLNLVDTYAVGQTEASRVIGPLAAADYISGEGDIEVSIKHIVFVPFLAFTFESSIDFVGVEVE